MAARKKPVSDLSFGMMGIVNLILGLPLFAFAASIVGPMMTWLEAFDGALYLLALAAIVFSMQFWFAIIFVNGWKIYLLIFAAPFWIAWKIFSFVVDAFGVLAGIGSLLVMGIVGWLSFVVWALGWEQTPAYLLSLIRQFNDSLIGF
jgi:hypothetical protein